MSRQKILIIILIVCVVIFLFVFKGGSKKTNKQDPANLSTANTAINSLNNDFISALLGVQGITLDTGLLSSPVFKSLKPSGAFVSATPVKGKNDPFSSGLNNPIIIEPSTEETNPRVENFGNTGNNDNLLAGVKVSFSKITSTTTVVSILGLPNDISLSISLKDPNGKTTIVDGFSYKSLTEEYTSTVTGLSTKTKYTVNILKPEIFSSVESNFQTK